jgi:hypothetical protein
MARFRDFFFVESIQEEFANVGSLAKPLNSQMGHKVWSMKKDDVVKMWNQLQGNMPIYMTPVYHPEGTELETYGEDGVRISGSWQFISGVLSRLKDVLQYENPNTRLRLIFRGVDKDRLANPQKDAYVFYINLENRSKGRVGRPKKPNLGI